MTSQNVCLYITFVLNPCLIQCYLLLESYSRNIEIRNFPKNIEILNFEWSNFETAKDLREKFSMVKF